MVDGALRAIGADPDLELLLVGPRSAADEVTAALDAAARERVSTLAVGQAVAMGDPAARGADPRTSIGAAMLAYRAADRGVHAVVSAGASGATVAAAVMSIGRMKGVRRPALAAILPSIGGPLVLLDAGAGMQANPLDLVQHAVLGSAYATLAAAVDRPRVGLLSVGTEAGKGDRLRRAADAALRVHPLRGGRYVGPVEGHDVVTGARAEVVVTDGFTGNVLLKGIEAALGVVPGAFSAASLPRAATLLGVSGTVVVCHGAAGGEEIASGIAMAARLVRSHVIGRLVDGMSDDRSDGAGGPPRFAEVPT